MQLRVPNNGKEKVFVISQRGKKMMREKIENAVLRLLMNFEEDFTKKLTEYGHQKGVQFAVEGPEVKRGRETMREKVELRNKDEREGRITKNLTE